MDDIIIGIKSTALKFGNKTKTYLSGFSVVMITGLILSGVLISQTWPYYTAVGLVGTHLANQVQIKSLKENIINMYLSVNLQNLFFSF